MAFDVAAARKAGYTESQIAEYLASQSNFDAKAARGAGYDNAAIISHLNAVPAKPKAEQPKAEQPKVDVDLTKDYLHPFGGAAQKREVAPYDTPLADLGKGPARRGYYTRDKGVPMLSNDRLAGESEMDAALRHEPERAGAAVRAFGRAVPGGVVPAIGGWAGAQAGVALGTPLAPFTGGLSIPAGAIIGALGGGTLGAYAQRKVTERIPDSVKEPLGQDDATLVRDAREHPYSVMAGGMMPGFMFGAPSRKIMDNLAGGALGGGMEAAHEVLDEPNMDLGKIAEATAFGALQSKGSRLQDRILGAPDTQIQTELRRHRIAPDDGLDIVADVGRLGQRAQPIDVLPESITGVLGKDAQGGSLNARTKLRQNLKDRIADVPRTAMRSTGKIAPTDTRTGVEAEAAAAGDIRAAQESVRPDVPLGDATAAVQAKLLAEHEAERAPASALFDEARAKGSMTVERRPPELDEDGGWAQMTPEQLDEYKVPRGGAEVLAREGDYINLKTGETMASEHMADQQTARGPVPEIAQRLRGVVEDFTHRPEDIPGTLRILSAIDTWDGADTAKLFAAQKSLRGIENVTRGTPAAADGKAAGIVRREIDRLLNDLHAEGRLTGDPDVLAAHKAANTAWARLRQSYPEGSLIGDLVETRSVPTTAEDGTTSVERVPVQDPDTARARMFGNLTDSKERVRDNKALRDRLGADSPEWKAFAQEAVEQKIGALKDNPDYVKKLAGWQKANPRMAELMLGPEGAAAINRASTAIAGAEGQQGAMAAGAKFRSMDPQDFQTSVSGMTGAARRDAAVTMRQNLRDAIKDPASAMALLRSVAGDTEKTQPNMLSLLPVEEARVFIRDSQAILRRVEKAQAVIGGAPVGELNDEQKVGTDIFRALGTLHGSFGRAVAAVTMDLLTGKGTPGMRQREADKLAAELLDPNSTDDVLRFVAKMYGQNTVQRLLDGVRAAAAKNKGLAAKVGRLPMAYLAGEASDRDTKWADVPKASTAPIDTNTYRSVPTETLESIVGDDVSGPRSGGSLADRNNNQGNLRASPWVRKLPGFKGEDASTRADGSPGFAMFDTPEAGADAHVRLLSNKYLANGANTPLKIVSKYNPTSDPRNTPAVNRNYAQYIAKRLGIRVGDPVPANRVGELAKAMHEFESGNRAD